MCLHFPSPLLFLYVFLPDFILITSFTSLKQQSLFFLHSLCYFCIDLWLHCPPQPFLSPCCNLFSLPYPCPVFSPLPLPSFIFPSHVLNAYFYLFTFWDLYSKTIFLLRHSQHPLEARYLSVFLIFHQPVPAYGWTISFLS